MQFRVAHAEKPSRLRPRHACSVSLVMFTATAIAFFVATCHLCWADSPSTKAVFWGLSLQTESVSDLSGGMRRGTRYDSLLHVTADVHTGAFNWFQGGLLHFDLAGIRSGEPSTNLVGDTQAVSNIAAPSAVRLYELWYAQPFASDLVQGRVGIIDFSKYFDVTEAGSDLINSTYGTTPTLSGNLTAPIYPNPGVAAMGEIHRGHWQGQFGLFQGDPENRSSAFHDGYLAVAESAWVQHPGDPAQGAYKFGLWAYEPHDRTSAPDSGAYFVFEQPLAAGPAQIFFTLGASPAQTSRVSYSVASGLRFPAPFNGRPDDTFSLGVARADLRGAVPETSYEASYVFAFDRHFTVQPDLQYVTNPGGTLPSAWVFILRLGLRL